MKSPEFLVAVIPFCLVANAMAADKCKVNEVTLRVNYQELKGSLRLVSLVEDRSNPENVHEEALSDKIPILMTSEDNEQPRLVTRKGRAPLRFEGSVIDWYTHEKNLFVYTGFIAYTGTVSEVTSFNWSATAKERIPLALDVLRESRRQPEAIRQVLEKALSEPSSSPTGDYRTFSFKGYERGPRKNLIPLTTIPGTNATLALRMEMAAGGRNEDRPVCVPVEPGSSPATDLTPAPNPAKAFIRSGLNLKVPANDSNASAAEVKGDAQVRDAR